MTLSVRAQRLADLIHDWPRVRILGAELWRLLDEVDPAHRLDPRRRTDLANLLDELAAVGVIVLPALKSFDRSEHPPLPRFVTAVRELEPEPIVRETRWHPDLAWAERVAGVSPTQFDRLTAINRWLHRERDDLVVPMRERSLEIFGDEKLLDRLMLTNLAGPERLTTDLFRVRRVVPPLVTRVVGNGDTLLVVENCDTFDSLARLLHGREGRIGVLGWGAGAAFEASVLSIRELDSRFATILYFGDIDAVGLRIPLNANLLAVATGLPPVTPAAELYAALLSAGTPRPSKPVVPEEEATRLAEWLPPPHRARVLELLQSGYRLAQEAVGTKLLSGNPHIIENLCGGEHPPSFA
ncbi:Wadjet anti-phage system protein JetD domain-containing protein [Nocardia sp. NPDC020380]|uniref:Wadjet anti-phage system protein JetD domain-containing protein n=1 Tax=Nocardia sp. NPDC020380 TaxID=3364309 RepID=UPI0037AE63B6